MAQTQDPNDPFLSKNPSDSDWAQLLDPFNTSTSSLVNGPVWSDTSGIGGQSGGINPIDPPGLNTPGGGGPQYPAPPIVAPSPLGPGQNPTASNGKTFPNLNTTTPSAPVPQAGQPGYNPVWLPGGGINPNYQGPGGTEKTAGGLSTLDPKSIASSYTNPESFLNSSIQGLLSSGNVTPDQLTAFVNSAYGLQPGDSIAYDPSRGSKGVLEMPAGVGGESSGYYSFDNGQWAFHPTTPETGGASSQTGGATGSNLPSNLLIDPNQFAADPYAQQVQGYILNALKEGASPVTQDDPTIAPMISALRGQQQRGSEDFARSAAERAYATGTPVSSGGFGSVLASQAQQANEGTQAGISNLMSQMLTDRRNRLMTALNIGSNYLNAEQSRMLQAELANVTNALNNQHFYDQLGTGANEFAATQNQNAVLPFIG